MPTRPAARTVTPTGGRRRVLARVLCVGIVASCPTRQRPLITASRRASVAACVRSHPTTWCRSRAAAMAAAGDKVLHVMRHGVTEMNVHLGTCRPAYGQPGFVDPLLYDTRLTAHGEAQAAAAARAVARLQPAPELLVVSPHTRALQTATLAFAPHLQRCRTLVQPLAAERLYLSSDVGRHKQQLAQEFPHFDFGHLPDVWWHSRSQGDPLAIHEEPQDVFARRVAALLRWLAARPERSVALVSHWGVLRALTRGRDFDNCELRSLRLSQLLQGAQQGEQQEQRTAAS